MKKVFMTVKAFLQRTKAPEDESTISEVFSFEYRTLVLWPFGALNFSFRISYSDAMVLWCFEYSLVYRTLVLWRYGALNLL